MTTLRPIWILGLCLALTACGSPTQGDATSDRSQQATASAQETMHEGLAATAENIAANMSGEIRKIEGPLFDDFTIDIDHAITMESSMQMGPSRTRILDLELLTPSPREAVDQLCQRLQNAGFSLNNAEDDGSRRKWDFRRYENDRNLQGVIVTISERSLRTDRPQHEAATALLSLTISDSRKL